MKEFLEYFNGCEINLFKVDSTKKTRLHFACYYEEMGVINYILEECYDIIDHLEE